MKNYTEVNVAKYLAENVLNIRKKRGVSQQQLAKIAGLPRTTLTNIESGSGNPSLKNLTKLSGALQVSIEELLNKPRSRVMFTKFAEVPVQKKGRQSVDVRNLIPEAISGIDLELLHFKKGGSFTGVPHVTGTVEYCVCVEGRLKIIVEGEIYTLNQGDVLAFEGNQKHSYSNLAAKQCIAVSVMVFGRL